MSRPVDHFTRGRDAYDAGKPNFCDDARLTGKGRDEWYRGWHHQQRLRSNPAAQADIDAAIDGIQAIRDLLNDKGQP
ncbi:hypothetical protein OVA24_06425 [Luteolibacter sp. SL250]|uniref:hypothetical protein n=1 Tax=Luteolibacter sp. SL250 TaxID=2995170 RepID=UPI00226DBC5E|nr:hypothetical protein [Luteolibacter sp. SL250]WAC21017.1 hypothetical protein OVA24_06425 [Luteolibacter sp. SL250]